MAQITRAGERHLDSYSETDPDRRRPAHATVRVQEASSVNLPANVRPHDEIAALIGALRRRFPGRAFRLLGDVDGHDVRVDVAR
jgi:hypothetical protein